MSRDLKQPPHPIVLFDGHCTFCDRSVQFIIARDTCALFRFAPVQSEVGRSLLVRHALPANHIDSLVLIEDDDHYIASTAALRIARRLRMPWPLFWVFIIVPRAIRDFVYMQFANRRYRWFGRTEHCAVPNADIRSRFLN